MLKTHGLGLVTSKKPAQYSTFGTSRLSVPSSTTQTRSTSRNSGAGQRGPQVWTALSFDNHFLANIKFYRDSRLVLSTSGWTRLLLKTVVVRTFGKASKTNALPFGQQRAIGYNFWLQVLCYSTTRVLNVLFS